MGSYAFVSSPFGYLNSLLVCTDQSVARERSPFYFGYSVLRPHPIPSNIDQCPKGHRLTTKRRHLHDCADVLRTSCTELLQQRRCRPTSISDQLPYARGLPIATLSPIGPLLYGASITRVKEKDLHALRRCRKNALLSTRKPIVRDLEHSSDVVARQYLPCETRTTNRPGFLLTRCPRTPAKTSSPSYNNESLSRLHTRPSKRFGT